MQLSCQQNNGLEVTGHADFCVGFGGIKAILAIKVVKLVSSKGSETFLVDDAQIKPG